MVNERQVPPEQPEFLAYSSFPSGKHKGKTHYIIVGAGIIGVCAAFYLTRHPNFDPEKHYITILESKRVAGGASGKAGGLLALWAFPQQIVPLSFQLHQDLSNEFNGEEEWGYRRLTTISVEGDITEANLKSSKVTNTSQSTHKKISKESVSAPSPSSSSPAQNVSASSTPMSLKSESDNDEAGTSTGPTSAASSPKGSSDHEQESKPAGKSTTIKKNSITIESTTNNSAPTLPENLKWINDKVIKEWNHLGNESTTAQVHPYQFTTFILKQCIATGCVELVIGKVDDIIMDEDSGECQGVLYYPSSAKAEYDKKSQEKVELYGDKVIMTIGPWTSKILPDCPISGLRAHSITIQPDNVNEISPYAVFTELRLNRDKFVSPEIYARKDEVYVCGEGDSSVLIPETTDDVEIVAEKCDELFNYVAKISPNLSNGKVLKRQACYLPVLDIPSSSGPLIGETNVDNLYLASGHSCWGINNAPVTGLLISELLLDGEAKSCDISALDPSLYFDASLVYDDEEDDEDEEDEDDEEDDGSYDEEDSYDEEEED